MDSDIVDRWITAEETIAMETSVVDGDKFVTVQRLITIGDGAPEMAVIPLARGEELDRVIAALQRARGEAGLAESANAVQPDTTTGIIPNSLVKSRVSSTIPLLLSNVVEGARRLLLVEGRTLSIGIIVIVLFVLFLGGR